MKILAVLAAAAAVVAPLVAVAGPAEKTVTTAVRYADLNLNNTQDATVMAGRIEQAALAACGARRGSLHENRGAMRRSECFRETVSRAVVDLNAPKVTAAFQQRGSMQLAAN